MSWVGRVTGIRNGRKKVMIPRIRIGTIREMKAGVKSIKRRSPMTKTNKFTTTLLTFVDVNKQRGYVY